MINKLVNQTIKLANKHPVKDYYTVAAIIVDKKGNLLASGYNIRKTHPQQLKYAKIASINDPNMLYKITLHAEIKALLKLNKSRKRPHSIIIARTTANNNQALAKPCPVCMIAIKDSGCKYIYYTTETGYKQIKL